MSLEGGGFLICLYRVLYSIYNCGNTTSVILLIIIWRTLKWNLLSFCALVSKLETYLFSTKFPLLFLPSQIISTNCAYVETIWFCEYSGENFYLFLDTFGIKWKCFRFMQCSFVIKLLFKERITIIAKFCIFLLELLYLWTAKWTAYF